MRVIGSLGVITANSSHPSCSYYLLSVNFRDRAVMCWVPHCKAGASLYFVEACVRAHSLLPTRTTLDSRLVTERQQVINADRGP